MTISVCAFCKNRRSEKIDGWITTCNAFPNGKPTGFSNEIDVEKDKVCSNKIGFELDPDKEEVFNRIFKSR